MLKKITGFFLVEDEKGCQKLNMAHGKMYIMACWLFALWTLFYAFRYYPFGSRDTAAGVLGALPFFIMALLSLAAAVSFFLLIKKLRKSEKFGPIKMAAVLGIVSYLVCETVNSGSVFKEYLPFTFSGIFLYILVYMIGAAVLITPKIWFFAVNTFFTAFTLIQYYVVRFRGVAVRFNDILNIKSALLIKGEYTFSLTRYIVLAGIVYVLASVLILSVKFNKNKLPARAAASGVAAAGVAVFMLFFESMCVPKHGFNIAYPKETVSKVGSMNMILYDVTHNRIYKPKDYSDSSARALMEQYSSDTEYTGTPVVIGILNESFADHTRLGEMSVNTDIIPVWRSLHENTIKGYVTVSPYGGNTCDSEYEFLTGNSLMFLPDGIVPYSTYFDSHKDSIVDVFNGYGFDTVGISPVFRDLWNVGNVYEQLGFDRTYFLDGEENIDTSFKDDSKLYGRIMDMADNRDKSKGMFIWTATMQNHSPYENYRSRDIKLEEPYDRSAEIYLNSLHLSDKATLELINHFRDYDEQVIIVMFGDHFPYLPDFEGKLLKGRQDLSGMERAALTHQTPFFIWSNRDISEYETDEISLNYLSDELMKAAGIPLSPAQCELENIRETVPVITAWGYRDKNGAWHSRIDIEGESKDVLDDYASMCYYRMFRQYN